MHGLSNNFMLAQEEEEEEEDVAGLHACLRHLEWWLGWERSGAGLLKLSSVTGAQSLALLFSLLHANIFSAIAFSCLHLELRFIQLGKLLVQLFGILWETAEGRDPAHPSLLHSRFLCLLTARFPFQSSKYFFLCFIAKQLQHAKGGDFEGR